MIITQIVISSGYLFNEETLKNYAPIIQSCIAVSWATGLILLTVNRYLEIKLNVKYPLYVTSKRVQFSLIFAWSCGFFMGVVIVILKQKYTLNILWWVYVVVYPIFESIFIFTCTYVYVYIFRKIKASRRKVGFALNSRCKLTTEELCITSTNSCSKNIIAVNKNTRKKRAKDFVPFYMIITFVLFSGVPELITMFTLHICGLTEIKSYVILSAMLMYVTGYVIDFVIYVVMFAEVNYSFRKLLRRIIK